MINLARNKGVTLPELLVAISVFAILAGIGVPSLASMLAQSEISTAQETISQSFRYARSVAMSHGAISTVDVDASANTITISVANGLFQPKVISIPSKVHIQTTMSAEFNAFGVPAVSGVSAVVLFVPNYTEIPQRTISITEGGQINVTR